jgi:5-methylcytosine-specific restriction enzyme A
VTVLRACVRCGVPTEDGYCDQHRPKPWETSRRRENRTVSGWEEQRRARRVLDRYLGWCHLCGKPGATEVDHVVPLAEGGPDDETNLAPIHDHCHRAKTQAEARRARS